MKPVRHDPCSYEACGAKPLYDVRRGLCRRHYTQLHSQGTLPPKPELDELLVRWRTVTAEGCWEWRGAVSTQGYGQYRGEYVHRLSLESTFGPIAHGLHVDHLCRNRICFNPQHLEAVKPETNIRRGAGAHIINTGQCAAGHLMDVENTRHYVTKKGQTRRICRACHRSRARKTVA